MSFKRIPTRLADSGDRPCPNTCGLGVPLNTGSRARTERGPLPRTEVARPEPDPALCGDPKREWGRGDPDARAVDLRLVITTTLCGASFCIATSEV